MKKILVFLCAITMCITTFTACTEKEIDENETSTTAASELSKSERLKEEAEAVYEIAEKYNFENPEGSNYTITFNLDNEKLNLDKDLLMELEEHFSEEKNAYRIAISLDPQGKLTKVTIWDNEEFMKAWEQGDYDAKTIESGICYDK